MAGEQAGGAGEDAEELDAVWAGQPDVPGEERKYVGGYKGCAGVGEGV